MRWCAIFDLDGVLINSGAQHKQSWEMLAQETGLPLPDDHFTRGFGMRNQQIIPELLQWTQVPEEIERLGARKEEIFRELIGETGMKPLPGVVVFLERLKQADVPCVIGTSTPRINLECVMAVTGLGSYFQASITAEDVKHGKPDPEVFLLCANRLGFLRGQGIVFEDATVGVDAGLAAGMRVVAVTTTCSRERLYKAHRIVDHLDELGIPDLENLVQ